MTSLPSKNIGQLYPGKIDEELAEAECTRQRWHIWSRLDYHYHKYDRGVTIHPPSPAFMKAKWSIVGDQIGSSALLLESLAGQRRYARHMHHAVQIRHIDGIGTAKAIRLCILQ